MACTVTKALFYSSVLVETQRRQAGRALSKFAFVCVCVWTRSTSCWFLSVFLLLLLLIFFSCCLNVGFCRCSCYYCSGFFFLLFERWSLLVFLFLCIFSFFVIIVADFLFLLFERCCNLNSFLTYWMFIMCCASLLVILTIVMFNYKSQWKYFACNMTTSILCIYSYSNLIISLLKLKTTHIQQKNSSNKVTGKPNKEKISNQLNV